MVGDTTGFITDINLIPMLFFILMKRADVKEINKGSIQRLLFTHNNNKMNKNYVKTRGAAVNGCTAYGTGTSSKVLIF